MKKIYTKTGDSGETSLYQGKRLVKSALAVEAYGQIDELNSFIGLSLSQINQFELRQFLKAVQHDLFTIGAFLAGYSRKEELNLEIRVLEMEKVIDELTQKLPQLNNFLLPDGSQSASLLHVVRGVARRTERAVVRFFQSREVSYLSLSGQKTVLKYLNRLSDFLFMLARFVNWKEGFTEEIWQVKPEK